MLFPTKIKGNALKYYNKSWSKISMRFPVMIICLGFISFVGFFKAELKTQHSYSKKACA